MKVEDTYSLYQLNEYLRRVIALNFNESIWIHCEISQIGQSRGHYYLDLIEKDDRTDEIKAQISSVIWYKTHLFISKKLGDLASAILQDGTQVMLKVNVDFNERYGLKLVIQDIDASYTIGQHELAKQKIIERLKKEGLLAKNAQYDLPPVIQNIAVISSESAAGYKDFIQQLHENPYGYAFNTRLFSAAMQGKKTEGDITAALKEIQDSEAKYDCILIIRGGGSKLDLGSFDNYMIANKIATAKIPVVTGIGHEIDNTVADEVAHTSLKTPTAVAEFVISHNMNFEVFLNTASEEIRSNVEQMLHEAKIELERIIELLKLLPGQFILEKSNDFNSTCQQLQSSLALKIQKYRSVLVQAEAVSNIADPIKNLKRGYAIVRQNDQLISSIKKLKKKESIEIQLADGTISTTITS